MDWKEVHHYVKITGESFHSIYLGKDIEETEKEKMINLARQLNPNIKIYQMQVDNKAFRLKAVEI